MALAHIPLLALAALALPFVPPMPGDPSFRVGRDPEPDPAPPLPPATWRDLTMPADRVEPSPEVKGRRKKSRAERKKARGR